jgi:DNA-binding NarL/FixJ family response regulator
MRGLYFTTDLMFSSRILGVAQAAGLRLTTVLSPAALAEQLTGDPIGLVIIDLASPGADVAAIAGQVRAVAPAARIVSYGPHVDHALLEAASRAGCDQVYSRGQFMQEAPRLLAETLRNP